MSSSQVVELQNVHFCWPRQQTDTLRDLSFSLNAGEHLFLKGPSGSGKSTLLSLLTGINMATQGSVTILGQNLAELKAHQRDKFRADNIGYIFQQFNLLPYLNVLDNVKLSCRFSNARLSKLTDTLDNEATRLLLELNLAKELHTSPITELSIGQQQRVAAARALIGAPPIIIADEPTSALDYENRNAFIQVLLEQVNKTNSTLIFVSHDPTLATHFQRKLDLNTLSESGLDNRNEVTL